MSLNVQPAPRISDRADEAEDSARQSNPRAGFFTAASASENPHGQNSSQKPIGRSQPRQPRIGLQPVGRIGGPPSCPAGRRQRLPVGRGDLASRRVPMR